MPYVLFGVLASYASHDSCAEECSVNCDTTGADYPECGLICEVEFMSSPPQIGGFL